MEDTLIHFFGSDLLFSAHAKQMILSAVLGFFVGLERAIRGKPASLRTFSVISVGSCLFAILSVDAAGGAHALPHDVTRIAAQIVSGVGFLGGGVIFKTSDRIEGITTGALIWLTAAIGMGCGFNQIGLVVWAFAIGIVVHISSTVLHYLLDRRRVSHIHD
jgi:putative Mg2+ transporter-C (MgtC) family protein